jgi:hypothetical protein
LSGENFEASFVCEKTINKQKVVIIYESSIVTPALAKSLMTELVELFKKGQNEIVPFYPDLSINLDENILDKAKFEEDLDKNIENLLEELDDYFDDNDFDKYAQNEYRKGFFNLNIMEEFAKNTRVLFSNIKEHVFIYTDIYDN